MHIEILPVEGYEKVIEARDPQSGLHCFIALHSTELGPALGGVRIYPYADSKSALNDALRLAKAMTYKTALAQIGIGGGKSVIIADPKTKTPAMLKAFGEVINTLHGKYLAAEDVGSTPQDMLTIKTTSPYVAALPTDTSSGDPSRFTAWGIWKGIQAVSEYLWESSNVKGKRIAIQGLGNVGTKVAEILFWQGARLILCDLDATKLKHYCHIYEAESVTPDRYISTPCDILCPCAMGGVLNQQSIPFMQCKAIAGGANNQLANESDALALYERGILYAPDFVINAGGIINAAAEFAKNGYSPEEALHKTNLIFDTLLRIFRDARIHKLPTNIIANHLAEKNLAEGAGRRLTPLINFS